MKRYISLFEDNSRYFYNYRRNKNELEDELIFCSDNPDTSKHYGNIQRIFKATNRTLKKVNKELINYYKEFIKEWSGETIIDSDAVKNLNPIRIVSSAGAWDNIEFINFLYDKNFFFEYDGLITNDGAIFFEVNKNNLVSINYL